GLASRTIARPSFNAARSCAVLISELPATLLRTPSKTFGGSRPYGTSCDCAFVESATALISISTTSNANLRCCLVVIDQLLFLRCKQSARLSSFAGFIESRGVAFVGSDVEPVCLRHFYQVCGADRARGDADAERRKHRSEFSFVKNQNNARRDKDL